jgi:iron complex outermembrane receptor protein
VSIVDFKKLFIGTLLLIGMSAPGFAPQVWAQDSGDDAADDEEGIEEITVTGSRIRRTEFSSSSPVQVINMEMNSMAGLMDVTDILQKSTIAGNSGQLNNLWTGFVVDGGAGVNTIDLRGLGATKTLVLMNGRRVNPAGTRGTVSSVDLNVVPQSIIQRIEILKDGASSVYGSDAVAGVVNIITRTDIDGVVGHVSSSIPADGGGEILSADLSVGMTSDRGSLLFGVEYFERQGLREADRSWSQCASEYYFDPDTGEDVSTIDPTTGQVKCWGAPANDYVVVIGGPNAGRWIRDPSEDGSVSGIPGWRIGSLAERPFDHPRQRQAHMVSPAQRVNIFSFGQLDFDALGGMQAYYEFMYNNRKSEQNGGPRQIAPRVAGAALGGFNPGDVFGGVYSLPLLLPYDQIGNQEVDWYRTIIGARGEFSNNWAWDVFASYGSAHASYGSRQFLVDRMIHALDIVDLGGGVYDCRINQEYNPFLNFERGDCVPWDPFADIGNLDNFDPDLLDYLSSYEVGRTNYDQTVLEGYVTGDLFDMPAGTAAGVLGFAWRQESIEDTPSSGAINGNLWGFTSSGVTAGTEKVKEVFGEIELPLLRGKTAFENLTFTASGRWTDYDTIGSDSTYKAGLDWQIVPAFRLRSTFGTSFRAPALFEAFLGGQTAFTSASDPCEDWDLENPNSPVYINCQSEGLPAGFPGYSSTPRVITFGNAGRLNAETSEALTVGAIVTLDVIDLSIAVDYFDIEIVDEIAKYGATAILRECYNDPLFRTPGTLCDFITPRDPTDFSIDEINDSFFNINKKNSKGIDYTIRYVVDVGPTTFAADLRATDIDTFTRNLFGGVVDDLNGQVFYPDWNAAFDLRADWKDWTFYYGLDWIGDMEDYTATGLTAADGVVLNTPDIYYHDLSVRYTNVEKDWSIQVGVTNLTDEEPPIYSDIGFARFAGGRAFYPGFDLRGRSFFISLNMGL